MPPEIVSHSMTDDLIDLGEVHIQSSYNFIKIQYISDLILLFLSLRK
jgi:hypothetical protein